MASSKAKTTMNKLNRERKVRERQLDKQARKAARANAPEADHADHLAYWLDQSETPEASEPASKS